MRLPALRVNLHGIVADNPYTSSFYEHTQGGSRRSAQEIVPLLLGMFHLRRVIDVGCGVGEWLSVFKNYGLEEVLGVDGDYVDRELLEIPKDQFLAFDLRRPLRLEAEFDLAMSLEVAEHLRHECAEVLVDSLVRLAPVILFSAAIPFQPGVNHVNGQWPEYWARYFRERGYVPVDVLRKQLWHNEAVEWWYAQNILLFIKGENLADYPSLKVESQDVLSMVHPKNYLYNVSTLSAATDPRNMSLAKVLTALPMLAVNSAKRRIDRLMCRSLQRPLEREKP